MIVNLDISILKDLQTNARKKQAEIARDLCVAQSTVLERARRLEEQGVVRGYRAIINPEKLGLHVQSFISIILNRHDADCIRDFEEGIRQLSSVRACYHLSGRYDYMLHVAVRDLEQLGDLIKSQIASLPGFGTSETFVVFSEIKSDEGWPIEDGSGKNL